MARAARGIEVQLTVNGQVVAVPPVADVRPYVLALARQQQFTEVWLDAGEEGPALAMLVNAEHAWLMYLRDHEGDPGFSSRNPHYAGPPDALMKFILVNGQGDQYPVARTLSLEQAVGACEYFVATQGSRSPDIVWRNDAADDAT
jgi:hypothetical protein